MAQDEPKSNDFIINTYKFPILLDSDTVERIEDGLQVDYNPSYGYVLKNDFETLSFGVKISPKQKS